MAHLYLFNPTHKLRLLSKLLFRSKRLLRNANKPIPVSTVRCREHAAFSIALATASGIYDEDLACDPDFYLKESQSTFCILQVENTLFKVHRCILLREPSAFADMFSLSKYALPREGESDTAPVILSDTVEQFRDLLWILYAPPSVFLPSHDRTAKVPFNRLLNIAEMTNKYCFESYANWATQRLLYIIQDPKGPLRNASPELLARVLHVVALCDHKILLDTLIRHLVSRLLWYNLPSDAILVVAERHRLSKIIGVIYYKQLINLEQAFENDRASRPIFSSDIGFDKRMQLLAAHESLSTLWQRLRLTPPIFHHDDRCEDPDECTRCWSQLWVNAALVTGTSRSRSSADVLERLKAIMLNLRKSLSVTTSMGVQCTMAALESISQTRDDIIEGLIDHFIEL